MNTFDAPPSPLPADGMGAGGFVSPSRRQRWRDRALLLAPAIAFGLVLVTLWAALAWYIVQRPQALRAEQQRDLANSVRTVAMQTESVLRQAESAMRVVDLWVIGHPLGISANDTSLAQLADSVRNSSSKMVDVVLVSRSGEVRRLQPLRGNEPASIAGSAAFKQAGTLAPEGISIGTPLRLGEQAEDGRWQLPLLMRLSRPVGDIDTVMALVDLQRLRDVQSLFMVGNDAALVLLRADGVVLSRMPELPGLVGRNLFEKHPARRADFSDIEGYFTTTGAVTDGRARMGAYVTLGDFGVRLLLSNTEAATLAAHHRQRNWLLAGALLATVLILLLGRTLGQMQRRARLRDAALQATSNAVPMGLFRCDASGRIVYVNDSYLSVHGMRRQDIAWGWTALVPPEQRGPLIERWKQHMASGEPIDMIRKMKRGDDGRIRLLAVRTAPLIINGRVAGQAGMVEDVTERGEQEKARSTLAAIFDMTPDLVCQTRENGEITYLNPSARACIGMAADAPLDDAHISALFHPEQLDDYRDVLLPAAMRDGHWRGRTRVHLREGRTIPVDLTLLLHRDVRGRVETNSIILRDLSEQLQAQRERERSEAMLLAMANTARAQIVVADRELRVIFLNAAFEARHGARRADWLGRPLAELYGPAGFEARQALLQAALDGHTGRLDLTQPRDTTMLDVQVSPLRLGSGRIEGVSCVELDVTEVRREEARLRLASQTDALTELLNRAGFEQGAQQVLAAHAAPDARPLALIYLDLDKFKPVNDLHGHPTGDALLKAVALRLRHALRPGDLVARLGGDEFAVLLPELTGEADAAVVADKLLHAISAPYHIGELELEIGVSLGLCVGRVQAGTTLEALVAEADAQLYEAKRAGRGQWRSAPPTA